MGSWSVLSEIFWFCIAALVVWLLSNLLGRERGPAALFVRFRSLFGVYHINDQVVHDPGDDTVLFNPVTGHAKVDDALGEIGLMLTCFTCCSLWVSLIVALALRHVAPTLIWDATSYLLITGALSACAIAFDSRIVSDKE